jgi:HPt (histidine-containing phosphotransfer) domain-containing protein
MVALTANAIMGDRERYLSAGFDEYISKPIRKLPLLISIQNLLGQQISPIEPPQESHTQHSDRAIDDQKFSEFLAERNPDRARALLDIFTSEMSKHREELQTALASHRFDKAQHSLHTIVGMSGSIGAMKLSAFARQYETACQRGDQLSADEMKDLFAEISATLAETAEAIQMLSTKVA